MRRGEKVDHQNVRLFMPVYVRLPMRKRMFYDGIVVGYRTLNHDIDGEYVAYKDAGYAIVVLDSDGLAKQYKVRIGVDAAYDCIVSAFARSTGKIGSQLVLKADLEI